MDLDTAADYIPTRIDLIKRKLPKYSRNQKLAAGALVGAFALQGAAYLKLHKMEMGR